jgi:two-component system chemotaxis sensor kinase CheA
VEAILELGKIEECLNKFTGLIGGFCQEEIPDLGTMLQLLDELIDMSKETDITFHEVSIACRGYVENITLENINNTKPIEEGILLLKSILSHLKRGEAFAFDYADVLEILNIKFEEKQETSEVVPEELEETQSITEPEKISEDDMEILVDFISEAEENLDTIEVNLIELEQDPSNSDIINEIFRPFHTIKGVSGFLALNKINKLSHTTENLLDSARSGDFLINAAATDAILESVDTLKNLIERLKQGTEVGFKQPDGDIDVDTLRDRLQKLQISLTKGEKEPLGEILVRKGEIEQEQLDEALEVQKDSPEKKIGEILVEEKKAAPKQIASALMEQAPVKKKIASQVKVSTEKLDDLVDFAGELVIAQSMLRQHAQKDSALQQSINQLGQIVTNMQNIAMSMRMIPIKATFMKMIRLVRDLSKKSGKEVALNMVGEDTEIDRNVVDALYEPLVHMIRNSADHGVEAKSERLETGKPSQGNIYLRAYHKGGHIIIEIEDDGKGLDKEQLIKKATDNGLIDGDEQMTDSQIYDLIMQPGFSTAKEVTDVSGRGVGMDVVKSGIEKFRGQLNIESTKGQGTKFTISLPLTLAIIDGMLVRVDDERYVIPTTAIQKAFKPGKDEYFTVEGKGEMVKDRGDLIPLIRLNEIYDSSAPKKDVHECIVVVVESKDEKRALLIDELLGKDEYVIKSLGNNLEGTEGLAGGAILGDGRIGLILDIYGIFAIVSKA